MTFKQRAAIPVSILLATLVNLILSYLSRFFYIPLYLDSAATIFVAARFGLVPAVAVAICTNGTLMILGISFLPFLLCHVSTALVAGLLFKKSKNLDMFLWVGLFSAILNTLIGSPYAIHRSNLENINSIYKGLLLSTDSVYFAFYYGGVVTNFLDKIISAYLAEMAFLLTPPPITSTATSSKIQYSRHQTSANFKGEKFYSSIKYIILILSFLNIVFTAVIKSFLTDDAKKEFYIGSNISNGFDLLIYSSLILIFLVTLILVGDRQKAQKEKETLDALNAETEKLSQNLHDSALQNLAMAQMMIENKNDEKSLYWIKEAVKNIRYLCGQLKLDFTESFETHIANTLEIFESSYKIKTDFFSSSTAILNFNQTQKIELNYILNECLSNAVRHSNPTKITVKIIDIADNFIMKIIDNGEGFDVANIQKSKTKHFGLENMQNRIKILNGSIDFKTTNGTEVTIKLPIS